jgi:hypothetical protein
MPDPGPSDVCETCGAPKLRTVKCLTCGKRIAEGTIKCPHCNAFQDRRRYFTGLTLFMTTLTAFVSVIGLTFTTVTSIRDRASATSAAILGGDRDWVSVGILNSGNGSSVTRDLRLAASGDVIRFGPFTIQTTEGAKTMLKGRDAALLHLQTASLTPAPGICAERLWSDPEFSHATISLTGTAYESDGSRTRLRDEVPIGTLRDFITSRCNCPCPERRDKP